jgi:hypothetical protein
MAGAVVAEDAGPFLRFLRWCGMALVVAGPLIAVATLLHPSRETAATIIASEAGLIAAHFLDTLAWLLVLLGLPGLYASQQGTMGRLGLAGFLVAFSGTYLIAVGFFAPVLAKEAPAVLDAIAQYWPVAVINGLAAIAFMIGYLLLGVAMTKTALPRRSGVFVAVGAPAHLLGLGISLLVSTAAWPVAILGSRSLGLGLGWSGYRMGWGAHRPLRICLFQISRREYERRIFAESCPSRPALHTAYG